MKLVDIFGPLVRACGIHPLEDTHKLIYIGIALFWIIYLTIFFILPYFCFKNVKPLMVIMMALGVGFIFKFYDKNVGNIKELKLEEVQNKQKHYSEQYQDKLFQIMTFNLRDSRIDTKNNTWNQRTDAAIQTIFQTLPDVIGTQEGRTHQFEDLQFGLQRLDIQYEKIGDITVEDTHDSAILYNPATVECLEQDTFWLSETPHQKQSIHPDSALTRTCTWGLFKFLKNDEKFYFFNTHLDHVGEQARNEQIRIIREQIEIITKSNKEKLAVFLSGDFNSPTDSLVYQNVLSKEGDFNVQFQDVRRLSPQYNNQNKLLMTFHAYQGLKLENQFLNLAAKMLFNFFSMFDSIKKQVPVFKNPQNFNIDFIFQGGNVEQLQPIENYVLVHKHNGYFPSDHYPLTAFYIFNKSYKY